MKVLRRCAVASLLVLLAAPPLALAQFPAQSETYRYRAVNRDLADVLRGFAADQRINIVISPDVPQQAISEQVEKSPVEFLDYITGKYGLVWYFDGTSLYVNRSDQLITRYFRPQYASPSYVVETMKALNAYSDHFPFRVLDREKALIAVGPPRLIEMAEFVLQMVDKDNGSAVSAEAGLAIIQLHHASAADQTVSYSGSTVTVPGVATLLQSLISGQSISGPATAYVPQDVSAMTQALLDQYQTGQLPPGAPHQAKSPLQSTQPDTTPETDADPPDATSGQFFRPTISADVRMNAILIRDRPDRLPAYRAIVAALDRPAPLVRITAVIIDIDKSCAFDWGLPIATQVGDGSSSTALSLELTTTDTANLALTLLKDDTIAFMQQVKALEQDGKARVVNRPSVLTLDNMEAQLSSETNFYVRVEGTYAADLYPVTTQTDLTVVPHLIEQDGKRQIRLSVQVNDGNVLTQTLDGIPYTRNDSITTQAELREDESLLIGGMSREETSNNESRIPVLGNLPGVGFLFKTKETKMDRKQRFILIEPQIVAHPSSDGEQQWLVPANTSRSNAEETLQADAPIREQRGKRMVVPCRALREPVPPRTTADDQPRSETGLVIVSDSEPTATSTQQPDQMPALTIRRSQPQPPAYYVPMRDRSPLRQAVYDESRPRWPVPVTDPTFADHWITR